MKEIFTLHPNGTNTESNWAITRVKKIVSWASSHEILSFPLVVFPAKGVAAPLGVVFFSAHNKAGTMER